MCTLQTGYAHVRRSAFTREGEREREEETDRQRQGGRGRGEGGGGGRESKQNLHGNSVPVGRVELWVFNAVLPAPLPFSLFPSTYALPPSSTGPSYTLFLSLSLSFTLTLSLFLAVFRFISFLFSQSL